MTPEGHEGAATCVRLQWLRAHAWNTNQRVPVTRTFRAGEAFLAAERCAAIHRFAMEAKGRDAFPGQRVWVTRGPPNYILPRPLLANLLVDGNRN